MMFIINKKKEMFFYPKWHKEYNTVILRSLIKKPRLVKHLMVIFCNFNYICKVFFN